MNKYLNARFIARTAVLLAITLAFQMLRFIFPNTLVLTYVISSLVNLSLIVSAGMLGLAGACVIAVLAPVMALIQGHAVAPMVVPIMLGNAAIVAAAHYAFCRKQLWILGAGAVVKYVVIALGMALFVLGGKNPTPYAAAFAQQFVQLVTAIIGSAVALPVLAALKKFENA